MGTRIESYVTASCLLLRYLSGVLFQNDVAIMAGDFALMLCAKV